MQAKSIPTAIDQAVLGLLECTLRPAELRRLTGAWPAICDEAADALGADLLAYSKRDPASHGRPDLILETYASFQAVICHRLAHLVWRQMAQYGEECEVMAQRLSNKGKILSGVEIHPAARLGRRFVLDHGYGTVIGETCVIGDDCYILSGVILGATGIANNRDGVRHPRIGHGVEIGSGARVLGPVVIGDHVFISPSSIITQDVPAYARVSVVNQVQLHKLPGTARCGYVSAFATDRHVHVVGESVEAVTVHLLEADHQPVSGLKLERLSGSRHHVKYELRAIDHAQAEPRFPLHLGVTLANQQLTVLEPTGLAALARGLRRDPEMAALD